VTVRTSRPPNTIGICTATLLADPMRADDAELRAAGEAAVAAGFTEASVWLQHLDALDGVALHVEAVEATAAWASADRATATAEAERFVAAAESVGASTIVAVCLEPRLTDLDHARRNLEALVAMATDVGCQVCVEFLPGIGIFNLAAAWDLVEPLGPGAGIVLDTWHWVRQPGGPAPDVLAGIPGERIGYVQVSDVAAERSADMWAETMNGRLLPGDGVVDFADLFTRLATIDAAPFVATEVFNPSLVREWGAAGAAAAMREAAAEVLSRLGG
jgi:sugar phosphate isomerase/epimerase